MAVNSLPRGGGGEGYGEGWTLPQDLGIGGQELGIGFLKLGIYTLRGLRLRRINFVIDRPELACGVHTYFVSWPQYPSLSWTMAPSLNRSLYQALDCSDEVGKLAQFVWNVLGSFVSVCLSLCQYVWICLTLSLYVSTVSVSHSNCFFIGFWIFSKEAVLMLGGEKFVGSINEVLRSPRPFSGPRPWMHLEGRYAHRFSTANEHDL